MEKETLAEGQNYWLWINRAVLDHIIVDLTIETYQAHQIEQQVNHPDLHWLIIYNACPIQTKTVHIPPEIVGMIARCAASQSDVCSLSLTQRSWQSIAQAELFGNVWISSALQSQHFINAFMCNIGPENPQKRHNRVPLETFVQNVYLDVTHDLINDRPSSVILRNFSTLVPIFSNIRSLGVKMAWEDIILRRDFKTILADLIPPSLFMLTIQVTVSHKFWT